MDPNLRGNSANDASYETTCLNSAAIKAEKEAINGAMETQSLKMQLEDEKILVPVQRVNVNDDEYSWRKYAERRLRSQSLMMYFKCANAISAGCRAQKVVEQRPNGACCTVRRRLEHTCGSSKNVDQHSLLEKQPKAMSRPFIHLQSLKKRNRELSTELVENPPNYSSLASVKHEEMPSRVANFDTFKESDVPAKFDVEDFGWPNWLNRELLSRSNCTSAAASPIRLSENLNGTQVLLKWETLSQEIIFVVAVGHLVPLEFLEFYFFNAKDMAVCVGVGLPQSKVILHNDLSITVEETTQAYVLDSNRHLVIKDKVEVPRIDGEKHKQMFGAERDETPASQLYGVRFDCDLQYVDESYNSADVSWPLLYDMALFILTSNEPQSPEENAQSNAQGSGSFAGNIQNSLVVKLNEKRDSIFTHGNLQGSGGEGGDDDDFDSNHTVLEDHECLPVVFKVTVHALPKDDIQDMWGQPVGLDGACIAPKLVFEFRQSGHSNRISIKAETHLELGSKMDVFYNTNLFGWYHNDIQISFGCEDIHGCEQSALLEQNSCKILNPKTSYRYTAEKSLTSSKATTYSTSGQGSLTLFGSGLQGSSSGSKMKEEAANISENIERSFEGVCQGFAFKNSSRAAAPARARFLFYYPFENLDIWGNKEFLQSQGLFSTIEPSIQGIWIPLNKDDAAPYSFKVERLLKLHDRVGRITERIKVYKQVYTLPFFVNHAMTHLRSQRSAPLAELYGNQQSVPNVLMVGSVNTS